jgi:hypothetical protein
MTNLRPCTGPLLLSEWSPHSPRSPHSAGLVPLGDLPWWSPQFFDSNFGDVAPSDRYLFDWQASLDEASFELPTRDPIVMVTEVPSGIQEAESAAVATMERLVGSRIVRVPLLGDAEALEEYYLLRARTEGGQGTPFEPFAAWGRLVATGAFRTCDPDGPSLLEAGHPADPDALWKLYETEMGRLSTDHPIRAVLERSTFDQFVDGSVGCVLVNCENGDPVSLALIGTANEAFDWMDPRWLEEVRSEQRDAGLSVFPGIVTRSDQRGQGRMARLLDLVVALLFHSSSHLNVVFPCNNASREYTPLLVQAAVDRSPTLSGSVQLVARYEYRGYLVAGERVIDLRRREGAPRPVETDVDLRERDSASSPTTADSES